jgi:threonine/homoserine/homoserine lactone efflux protein
MQLLLSFIIGAAVGVGMTIPMGPISVYVAQQILNHESRKGAYVVLGSVLIDTAYCLIITMGFISLIHPFLQNVFVQLGLSVFLIVYGIKMLFFEKKTSAASSAIDQRRKNLEQNHYNGIIIGATIAAANPTLFVSWIAVISFASAHGLYLRNVWDKLMFSFAAGLGSLAWFIGLMFFVRSRRHSISPKFMKMAGVVTAMVVLVFGVYFTGQVIMKFNVI